MKMGWRGVLGLVLSVALLAWTLRDVEFAHVWDVLRHSNLGLFALSALVATLLFPVRAIRWRYILEPVAEGLPLGSLFRATSIGMMVNNTVPARAGEFARAYALSRETSRVSFPNALASLVIDRAFDAVVIVGILVTAMWSPTFPGSTTLAGQPLSRIAALVAIAALGLLSILAMLAFWPAAALRYFDAIARRVSPKLAERGGVLLQGFAHGLGSLKSPRLALLILFWTVVHWLMGSLSFYLAFRAVGIQAPFNAALFLQSVIALGVAVPASPGFFGLFEFFGREGLGVYGVSQADAVSWALGYHILSFLPITIIGAWYFTRLGMHLADLKSRTSPPEVEPA
ncbi:MAG: lysylphosphatidylglycerol synthase transmembrane domain-containing protein [Gemmatimonadaceae bacterium]